MRYATETDRKIIARDNASADGGDVSVDALLYEGSGRRDYIDYKQLYGMQPSVVLTIGPFHLWLYLLGSMLTCSDHKPTISVVNAHAGGHRLEVQSAEC